MAPPPAYHLVVDPHHAHTGIPIQTPFGESRSDEDEVEDEPGLGEGDDREEEEGSDDVPEVTVNAATQVRGHGNIISVAQMDSGKIAGMVYSLLNGVPLAPPTSSPTPATGEGTTPPHPHTCTHTNANTASSPPSTTNTTTSTSPSPSGRARRMPKAFPKIHITINCGATVIGDRNVVGPGLGDIARNIQVANQRVQMAQMQARAAQAAQAGGIVPGIQIPATTPTQMPSPPMSRSSSGDGEKGIKRKAGEDVGVGRDAKKTYISGS